MVMHPQAGAFSFLLYFPIFVFAYASNFVLRTVLYVPTFSTYIDFICVYDNIHYLKKFCSDHILNIIYIYTIDF